MGIPYFGIFWVKKILRLTNYGLFAEETFADLGKKTQTFTFFPESNLWGTHGTLWGLFRAPTGLLIFGGLHGDVRRQFLADKLCHVCRHLNGIGVLVKPFFQKVYLTPKSGRLKYKAEKREATNKLTLKIQY